MPSLPTSSSHRQPPVPARWAGRLRRLHDDQRGSISITSLLVLLVFTMLLVMITNVGRHADDKLKMQNAADSAAMTGGVMLARGLNGLAHTNHLLCEVFAITAYLREGEQRNAEQQVPGILQAWGIAGGELLESDFARFPPAGQAVLDRLPFEQQAVTTFGNEHAAAAAHFLPIFEHILSDELIPQFQRTLVESVPQLAVAAAQEAARRHARPTNPLKDGEQPGDQARRARPSDTPVCVLFRANTHAIGEASEGHPQLRTLPAIDPSPTGNDFGAAGHGQEYYDDAVKQRSSMANHYLELWNDQKLDLFDRDARMSRFAGLWRIATRGQLDQLLNREFPLTNLPFQIRRLNDGTPPHRMHDMQQKEGRWLQVNRHLDKDYHVLAVVYRRHLEEMGPGLFENPLAEQSDAQSFAQLQVYMPEPRYIRVRGQWVTTRWVPIRDPRTNRIIGHRPVYIPFRENWPRGWDLMSQNWTTRLMPVALPERQTILGRSPSGLAPGADAMRPGPFATIPSSMLDNLITH